MSKVEQKDSVKKLFCKSNPQFGAEPTRKAAAALAEAFCWDGTKEGHDYWLAIYEHLLDIAKYEPKEQPPLAPDKQELKGK